MPEGEVVTRTVRASIQNHAQVRDNLDRHAFAASKLWNVGLWTIHHVWDGTSDYILSEWELSAYLKTHERYRDLPAQSSQRILQEFSLKRSTCGTRRIPREHGRELVAVLPAEFARLRRHARRGLPVI